jgi:glycosyltransferase involved in cell wall biosynthesis
MNAAFTGSKNGRHDSIRERNVDLPSAHVELSLVIPVFNGAETIGPLMKRIHRVFADVVFEVVLVNDGSRDASEAVCGKLADHFPETVVFVHLSRNFGEHNAVLCGLQHTCGNYVGVLDDDGQNPPEEVFRMFMEIKARGCDVMYGHYIEKKHSWFRNLGSRFNDRMATLMLQKPPELYLSSFKVMNRFVVDEITKYRGAFPYIDGLIYRSTRNIDQMPVEHRANTSGPSRYTVGRLVRLWLNMFLNFSIAPLRMAVWIGCSVSALSVFMMLFIWIDKIWITKNLTPGIPTVLGCIVFFSGLQLMMVGLIGEYLGRLYLDSTGTPQSIVRYVKRHPGNASAPVVRTESRQPVPAFTVR